MKRKIVSIIAIAILLFGISAISASAETYGDLTYQISDDGSYIEITGCDAGTFSIVIPDEINGIPVTAIGDSAFYAHAYLTNVTIPDSVTTIGYNAFAGCDSLTSITIPGSVTDTGFNTFSGCTGLTNVTIENGATYINFSTFEDCTNLKSVSIPKSVTNHHGVFIGCTGLSYIEYEGSEADWAELEVDSDCGCDGDTYLGTAAVNYNSPIFGKNAIDNKISVTKTEDADNWSFAIKIDKQTLDTDYAYVGIYNEYGNMITYTRAELSSEGTANISIAKKLGADYAKVFVWRNVTPLAFFEKIDL